MLFSPLHRPLPQNTARAGDCPEEGAGMEIYGVETLNSADPTVGRFHGIVRRPKMIVDVARTYMDVPSRSIK